MIRGDSVSMIQGKAVKVYPAFVTQLRISNEETLELITAPSSVVLGSNRMADQVRVVNCKDVERILCVVEKMKFSALSTEDEDHHGLTQ